MTLLLFDAAGSRYGLDIRQVVEVVPAVTLRPVAHAPQWLAGVFHHRGAVTPVISASALLAGGRAQSRFSTRIVVARYPGTGGAEQRVGLLVENATDTLTADEATLQHAGVTVPDAPYLGRVTRAGDTLVQIVRVEQILPDSVRAMLATRDGG
jgi:chemotaxis-related protein WspB